MKRCCYLLLTALLLMLASTASAATSGNFKYEIKGNGTATITGYSGASDENIIIPQMVDGYTVAAIGDKAFYKDGKNKEIGISVTLPETVQSIGDFAFWNANVTSINLPDGLESIGKGVFVGCDEIVYRVSANHPMFAVIDGALYNKNSYKEKKARAFRKESALSATTRAIEFQNAVFNKAKWRCPLR